MSKYPYYCLVCKHSHCYGREHGDFRFLYHHKLRVPNTLKNKARFRNFLDYCPEFVNMIEDDQKERFLNILREVKYFNKSINGMTWTNIEK